MQKNKWMILWCFSLPAVTFSRIIYSLIVQYVVDQRNMISSIQSVFTIILIVLLVAVILSIGQVIHHYYLHTLIQNRIKDLRINLIHSHLYGNSDQLLISKINQTMMELEINHYIPFYEMITQVIILIASLIMMLNYSIVITIIYVLFGILSFSISSFSGKSLKQTINEYQQFNEEYVNVSNDIENGRFVIRMHNAHLYILNRFKKVLINILHNRERNTLVKEGISSFSMFMMCMNGILITMIGIYLISKDEMTLGQLLAISTLSSGITKPIQTIIKDSILYRSSANLYALCSSNELVERNDTEIKSFNLIEIEDARICYDNKIIQQNLYLQIHKGEKYILTGPNGSGKSSLLKCLLGINQFATGSIILDHKRVDQLPRSLFSYVSQNVFLFDMKVKEYLEIQDNSINHIEELFKIFNLDITILNQTTGKGGSNLSSGMKQKLAIIKAVLSDRPIMVLDEALSGIDVNARKQILEYIINSNKTVIMIEHYDLQEIMNLGMKTITLEGSLCY